jgi:mycothiol synthase
MPRLSNFTQSFDPQPSGQPILCRPVQRPEIEPALRLMLSSTNGLAEDQTILEFLSFAAERKIDVNQLWIALIDDQIAWVALPIPNPGRTLLLFTPAHIAQPISVPAAQKLVDAVCAHWHQKDMQLAQLLLDPRDEPVRDLYISCGFELLAELIYLQRHVRGEMDFNLPAGFELLNYSEVSHANFAATILQSYEGSLDCPSLNGRRDINDVMIGHKSTGIFDPSLWYLLTESGQPRGVLILSASQYIDAVELVYLGLAPSARHRGLGDVMMKLALQSVAKQKRSMLSLAVDSLNEPALKLYHRHGLKRIGSRLALLRDLRVI